MWCWWRRKMVLHRISLSEFHHQDGHLSTTQDWRYPGLHHTLSHQLCPSQLRWNHRFIYSRTRSVTWHLQSSFAQTLAGCVTSPQWSPLASLLIPSHPHQSPLKLSHTSMLCEPDPILAHTCDSPTTVHLVHLNCWIQQWVFLPSRHPSHCLEQTHTVVTVIPPYWHLLPTSYSLPLCVH
jgi:hypothetical protein